MITKPLSQIAEMSGGALSDAVFSELRICGVSTDSRAVNPGNLFVPLVGDKFDGHEYVKLAFEQGVSCALWQRGRDNEPKGLPLIYVDDTLKALQRLAATYRSELKVRIVGITGSNGKTTTKDMVASILATTYRIVKTEGNLNNHIGLPLTLLRLAEDTEMAVVEMGMSGRGEIELLSKMAQPEAVVITNIGEAHLLQLGSREEIAAAKLEIMYGLKPGGLAVYNGDEPLLARYFEAMAEHDSETLRFCFGSAETNDYYPIATMLDEQGTHFSLNTNDSLVFYIPLLGIHNVINALAAIAVCKFMGVVEHDIVQGLKETNPTGMRTELVRCGNGLTIVNDAYNASPTSFRAALELFREIKGYRRKIVVLGDMLELGAEEIRLHEEIASLLSPRWCDAVYAYGDLARHIALAAEADFPPGKVFAFANKEEIVKEIAAAAAPQDIVLVKGSRGMHLEDVVKGLQNALA